jgi:predicted amidohydrolase YtcJ
LPDSFIPRTYPIRAMLDAGVRVALSSDAPVVEDDNPLVGAMAAVTRRDREGFEIAPEQAITVDEALRGYTLGGAVATGQERRLGSVEPGKWADLAVLSDDPLTVDVDALPNIKVNMTLLNGRVVYERA